MSKKTIEATMPGIFYRRPEPDQDSYVEEGDSVSEGDIVGLIGVMKSFQDIIAPATGTVSAIFVENETEVEAGDSLLEIEI